MPRRKKQTYALADDGNGGLVPVAVGSGSGSVPSVPSLPADENRVEAAARAFQWFLERTDGWLRVIPAGYGKESYFKWKFSNGEHKGKYVMYVAHQSDWAGGILGLEGKLMDVDVGARKPANDKFYDPR